MKAAPNNFDLIRLFAASQVLLFHTTGHLGAQLPPAISALSMFPGVPIFFFISGFLIYGSYAQNNDVRQFARHRFLRLYPGLIVCFCLSLAAVFSVGYLTRIPEQLPLWVAAQLTFFQFYNPDFMRGFGVGVLNGSLWTITVELQFYALTPLIFRLLRTDRALIVAITLFALANVAFSFTSGVYEKLLLVSFVPWVYMFLLGALASRHLERLKSLARYWPYLLVAYVACTYAVSGLSAGNAISPPLFLLLAAVVLAVAYSAPTLAHRTLHRNDISYGLYIYHMPVVNVLLYLQHPSAWLAIGLTITLAATSWFLIEKPSLQMKRVSAQTVGVP